MFNWSGWLNHFMNDNPCASGTQDWLQQLTEDLIFSILKYIIYQKQMPRNNNK